MSRSAAGAFQEPMLKTLIASLVGLALAVMLHGPAAAQRAPVDPTIEARIDALLSRMTLQEKVGQLHLTGRADPTSAQVELIKAGKLGNMMNTPTAREINLFQGAAAQSRLRIPLLFGLDAVNVFRVALPAPIAWAATWSAEAAELAAFTVGNEAAAVGINWTFAPAVDMSRDPRWGRVIESAGEDPYLAAVMAAARVKGYRRAGLATTAKHFVGYGAGEAGRDYNGATLSPGDLFDIQLPPFKAALDAGSETVMASFNAVNGMPVTASRYLLTDVLRDRLKFDGLVTSDFGSIGELMKHGIAADLAQASRRALHAGVDLDMESHAYTGTLEKEVSEGRIPVAEIDLAVRRILRTKFRMGLFEKIDKPVVPRSVDEATVRAAARRAARESFVLLKNDGAVLPLDRHKRIALIGTWAQTDDDGSWYGPAELTKADTTSLRRALVARAKPDQTITYVPGFADPCGMALAEPEAAVAAARNADVAIVVVSEDCEINGEGTSRTSLFLSGVQQDLLDRVAATGTPVAMILNTGRPLTLSRVAPLTKAILVAWQGGTEGRNALAEVLFGEAAPSGKLPMTFPRSVGQIPIYYNHLPTGRPPGGDRYTSRYLDEDVTPLYPFGWGLSYTSFAYANPKVAAAKVPLSDTVEISFDLTNTGSRPGMEVAQLYTRQPVASRSRPVRELKRFEKIELKAGETRRVTFKLPVAELGFHDDEANYTIEPGRFEVYIGGSSLADLKTEFEVVR